MQLEGLSGFRLCFCQALKEISAFRLFPKGYDLLQRQLSSVAAAAVLQPNKPLPHGDLNGAGCSTHACLSVGASHRLQGLTAGVPQCCAFQINKGRCGEVSLLLLSWESPNDSDGSYKLYSYETLWVIWMALIKVEQGLLAARET